MNFSQDVLLVLLISILASATNTELANNSTILLILLLALAGNNFNNTPNPQCCSNRLFWQMKNYNLLPKKTILSFFLLKKYNYFAI